MSGIFEVIFLGTNGSCPYNNGLRRRYGTNTLCVAMKINGQILIFDAGTGICGLNNLEGYKSDDKHLFLSHYHEDHICGLIFWKDIFNPEKKITIYGHSTDFGDVEATIEAYVAPPFYPIGIWDMNAQLSYKNISPVITLGDIAVKTINLSHPGDCTGYKVSYAGKSVCYLTDIEYPDHKEDEELLKFVQNTDLLIMDGFFNEKSFIQGWGHSTFNQCAELANVAGAGKLALYHHNSSMSDDDIDAAERQAKEIFEDTFAAADNLRVIL